MLELLVPYGFFIEAGIGVALGAILSRITTSMSTDPEYQEKYKRYNIYFEAVVSAMTILTFLVQYATSNSMDIPAALLTVLLAYNVAYGSNILGTGRLNARKASLAATNPKE